MTGLGVAESISEEDASGESELFIGRKIGAFVIDISKLGATCRE